jgi:hypothetical protein
MIAKYLISVSFFLLGLYFIVGPFHRRGVVPEQMVIGFAFWSAIPPVWLWKRWKRK